MRRSWSPPDVGIGPEETGGAVRAPRPIVTRSALVLGPAATLLYVVSWFLPVAAGGSTLESGVLPGWEAVRLALSPLWPYDAFVAEGSLRWSIAVASAVTNVLFVACCWALLQAWRHGRSARWIAYPLIIAALINAAWLWLAPVWPSWGFYCWIGSFLLLALAADRLRARPVGHEPDESGQPEDH